MTEPILIPLSKIQPNPYQPRIVDDPEHIEKLARSIAADKLLQVPMARNHGHNRSCELAFGHSRRKAFEWLRDNWKAQGLTDRYTGYTVMPLEVVELTDEEMYRYAITENVQRKDLNPIEQLFAKLKHWLRAAQFRSIDGACTSIAAILNTLSPAECANYLRNAGYASV